MTTTTDQEPKSLRALFEDAETKRKALESSHEYSGDEYQDNLSSAIATYNKCSKVADQVSLFSPNESLEDVSSGDLQYFLIDFYIAELVQKIRGTNPQFRKSNLQKARHYYGKFLKLLDSYDLLSKPDAKLFERYTEAPDSFSTASTTDAAARRETKIARFRAEKEMKTKLGHLRENPSALQNDEAALRNLHLTNIAFNVHTAFSALESIAQEMQILAMAPPEQPSGASIDAIAAEQDARQRLRGSANYSERLDPPLSSLTARNGPLLSSDGKPMRPFTLLDNRQQVQAGVFRPDHSLPTMTIDEYLDEERRRGGIIEGGGEQSGIRPEPDEDDLDKADEETMKARAWDEFTEDNPKGAGNTMNRG
ncbi:type 2A phosphatase-associated protein 42 [Phyllosticta citriasiana]|uniref:Type 2A phosphatase-associated protein 42 n=1 Tax=Phyllosticta citriasiana TaxID=595635 RepID=A0ABR1KE81_9PEZI